MNLALELSHGIEHLGLDIPIATQQNMLVYLELLQKWNKVYNLTAIRQPEQMVTHHLLDSLAVLPHLWMGRWLDVGCGAGLPGLVLAMAKPEWKFTLLDSNSKKTSFVQQAIIDLKLSNVNVCCARAEEWEPNEKFDGIISRAFAELADFIAATRHLLADGGRWIAMKGHLERELKMLPADIKIEQIILLQVPGLKAARRLAVLQINQE
ncbi:MAG TPA: 16S rRNA (guanine(527)-N(7))-methyltransferase RsmG [Gallionellaceae bacterium]|nr:16S rRNA (guanine(527)-N(7))-methyltransferase RsmG [Gallionellaceae bacterium]